MEGEKQEKEKPESGNHPSFQDIVKERSSTDAPAKEDTDKQPREQSKSEQEIIQDLQSRITEMEKELRTAAEIGQELLNVKESLEHDLESERHDSWKARQETQSLWERVEDLGSKLYELQCVNLELSAEHRQEHQVIVAKAQDPFISEKCVSPDEAANENRFLKKMVDKLKSENTELKRQLEEEKIEREVAQKVQQQAQQMLTTISPTSSPARRKSDYHGRQKSQSFDFQHIVGGGYKRSQSLPIPVIRRSSSSPSYADLCDVSELSSTVDELEEYLQDGSEEKQDKEKEEDCVESVDELEAAQNFEALQQWNLVLQEQLTDQKNLISALRSQVRLYRKQVEPHSQHYDTISGTPVEDLPGEIVTESSNKDADQNQSKGEGPTSGSDETDEDGEHLDLSHARISEETPPSSSSTDGRKRSQAAAMFPPSPLTIPSQSHLKRSSLDSFYNIYSRTPVPDSRARSAPTRSSRHESNEASVEEDEEHQRMAMTAKLLEAKEELENIVHGIQQTEDFFADSEDEEDHDKSSVLDHSGFGSESGGFGRKSLAAELAAASSTDGSDGRCARCKGLKNLDGSDYSPAKQIWSPRDETAKIQKALNQSEATVTDLRKQLEKLQSHHEELQEKVTELTERDQSNSYLQKQLNVAEEQMIEMQAEHQKQIEHLEKKRKSSEDLAEERQKNLEAAQSEHTVAASRISLLEMERDGLQQKLQGALSDLKQRLQRSESSQKLIQENHKDKQEIYQQQIETLKEEIDSLNASTEKEINDLKIQFAAEKKEIFEKEAEITKIQNKKHLELSQRVEKLEAENRSLKSELATAEDCIHGLEDDMTTSKQNHQSELDELTGDIEALQASETELQHQVDQLASEVESLEAIEVELEETIEHLKEQHQAEVEEKTRENENIQEHFEEEVHNLEEENAQLQGAIDDLQLKLARYFEELQVAQEAEVAKAAKTRQSLEEVNKRLAEQVEVLQQKDEELTSLQTKFTDLQSLQQETQQALDRVSSELNSSKESSQMAKANNEELQTVHSELEKTRAAHERSSQALIDAGKSIQRASSQTDMLEEKNQLLEAERKGLLSKLEQYESKFAELEEREKSLAIMLEASEKQNLLTEKNLAEEIQASTEHKVLLKERELALSQALDSLKAAQQNAEMRFSEAQQKWTAEEANLSECHQRTIDKLQASLQKMEERLKLSEDKFASWEKDGKAEFEQLEAEKARLLESLQHANAEAEEFLKNQTSLQREVDQLLVRNNELEKEKATILELADYSSNAEAIQSSVVKDLKAKIAKAREDKKELVARNKDLELEFKQAGTELQETYARAAQAEKERDMFASTVETTQMEKVKLETRLRRVEAESEQFQGHKNEIVRLECKITSITVELDATKNLLDEQRQKNLLLRREVDALERDKRELRSGLDSISESQLGVASKITLPSRMHRARKNNQSEEGHSKLEDESNTPVFAPVSSDRSVGPPRAVTPDRYSCPKCGAGVKLTANKKLILDPAPLSDEQNIFCGVASFDQKLEQKNAVVNALSTQLAVTKKRLAELEAHLSEAHTELYLNQMREKGSSKQNTHKIEQLRCEIQRLNDENQVIYSQMQTQSKQYEKDVQQYQQQLLQSNATLASKSASYQSLIKNLEDNICHLRDASSDAKPRVKAETVSSATNTEVEIQSFTHIVNVLQTCAQNGFEELLEKKTIRRIFPSCIRRSMVRLVSLQGLVSLVVLALALITHLHILKPLDTSVRLETEFSLEIASALTDVGKVMMGNATVDSILLAERYLRLSNTLFLIEGELASNLAGELFKQDQNTLAADWWDIASKASMVELQTNIGVAKIANNESYDEALVHFKLALKHNLSATDTKRADVWNNLAVAMVHPYASSTIHDFPQAKHLFEEALNIYQQDEDVTEVEVVILHNLAVSMLLENDRIGAGVYLRKAENLLKGLLGAQRLCSWCHTSYNEGVQLLRVLTGDIKDPLIESIAANSLKLILI